MIPANLALGYPSDVGRNFRRKSFKSDVDFQSAAPPRLQTKGRFFAALGKKAEAQNAAGGRHQRRPPQFCIPIRAWRSRFHPPWDTTARPSAFFAPRRWNSSQSSVGPSYVTLSKKQSGIASPRDNQKAVAAYESPTNHFPDIVYDSIRVAGTSLLTTKNTLPRPENTAAHPIY